MDRLDYEESATDRRRHPRIEVLGRVQGQLRRADVDVTLLNLSQGGFLIETPTNIPPGVVREFLITIANTASFVVRARSRHSMRVTTDGGVTFAVGCEFSDPENAEVIAAVLGLLQAAP